MKYCAQVAYDGTNYHGFQIQKNENTIQSQIEKALSTIYKRFVRINYAGRTDAGVHATAQFIDFSTNEHIEIKSENIKKAMNSLLPKDIRIMKIFEVNDDFHSRYRADFRDYTYFIYNNTDSNPFFYRYSWHIPKQLNIGLMRQIKHIFEGERDFSFVANELKNKNCTRYVHFIHISRFKNFIIIHIRANGFLRGMVRNVVGILVSFSKNTLKINISDNIIRRQSGLKSFKAPPNGLFLTNVNYRGELYDKGR